MSRKFLASTAFVIALSGAAAAADLPPRSALPVYIPPPPLFTWTGLYIGGQIGYQWGTTSTTATVNATGNVLPQPNYGPNGVIGGAHIGYNWQVAQLVFGLEGDVDGADYHGSGFNNAGIILHTTREAVEGSIRGRIGYAFDRVLVYGTGGVAFTSINTTFLNQTDGLSDAFNTGRVGWTAGGGIEYAVTNNWSVRAEYRYTDFGSYNVFLANSTAGTVTTQKCETDNAVTAGFSYKFDVYGPAAPAVAKY